ncbi:HPr family phosphocarrier protein [Paenibacillus sp. strain BS8-2]
MEQSFTVLNPSGIHARPANLIMEKAHAFTSTITLRTETRSANARSMVSLLKLSAKQGDQVIVAAEGDDAEAAVRAIGAIIQSDKE